MRRDSYHSSAVFFGSAVTIGFIMGIGASAVTAIGMYVWYYGGQNGNDHDRNRNKPRGDDDGDSTNTAAVATKADASISFLSDMMNALWDQLNTIATNKIRTKCQPVFATLSYPFNNLHFTQLNLGHVPFRMDHVRVSDGNQINSITKQKYIQITFDMIWDGECNIQLQSSIGKFGIRSIKFRGRLLIDCQPIGDTTPSSILPVIQYTFINTPEIYITDFTGLASIADIQSIKATIQSAIIESIEDMNMVLPKRTVMRITHDTEPSFLDIYQPPIGVLQISLIKGYGFDINGNSQQTSTGSRSLFRQDIPDMYCTISIGNSNKVLWKSSVIRNSNCPIWKEVADSHTTNDNTIDTLLFHYDQIITFSCYDSNTIADDGVLRGSLQKDTLLGVAKVTVAELLFFKVHDIPLQQYRTDGDGNNNTIANTLATLLTGAYLKLQCHLFSFEPYQQPLQPPPQQAFNPDSIYAVVTILISQAFDVPETGTSSYVMVTFGSLLSLPLMVPISIQNKTNHIYDGEYHIPITYRAMEDVKYNIEQLPKIQLSLMDGAIPLLNKDKNQYGTNPNSYGSIEISLSSMVVKASECKYNPGPQSLIKNNKSNDTKLEFFVSLRTVVVTTVPSEPSTAHQAAGVPIVDESNAMVVPAALASPSISGQSVKVTIVKGWGFHVEKRGAFKTNDIPDLYCIVQCGSNPTTFTTSIDKNTTTPSWNESFTFLITSDGSGNYSTVQQQLASTLLRIDVYDSDTGKLDDDDEVGHVSVPIQKVLIAPNHTYDCELLYHGKPTNAYICIRCEKVMG